MRHFFVLKEHFMCDALYSLSVLFLKDKAFWQSQMDVLVKKALDSNPVSDIGPNSLNPPIVSSTKPCRYGQNCTRPGCRFKHPGRATGKWVIFFLTLNQFTFTFISAKAKICSILPEKKELLLVKFQGHIFWILAVFPMNSVFSVSFFFLSGKISNTFPRYSF